MKLKKKGFLTAFTVVMVAGVMAIMPVLNSASAYASRNVVLGKIHFDAGHGIKKVSGSERYDGASGYVQEDKANLQQTNGAIEEASKYGVPYSTTCTDGRWISINNRWKVAMNADADIFISFHNNAASNSAAKGYEVLQHSSMGKGDSKLAGEIRQGLGETEFLGPDRGSKGRNDLGVLLNYDRVAVIVEPAFVTNKEEGEILSDAQKNKIIGQKIAQAAMDYLNIDWRNGETYAQAMAKGKIYTSQPVSEDKAVQAPPVKEEKVVEAPVVEEAPAGDDPNKNVAPAVEEAPKATEIKVEKKKATIADILSSISKVVSGDVKEEQEEPAPINPEYVAPEAEELETPSFDESAARIKWEAEKEIEANVGGME